MPFSTRHILAVVFVLFLAACKSGYRESPRVAYDQPDDLPTAYKTIRGVTVYSEQPPTGDELALIDAGISATINRAFKPDSRFTPPTLPVTWKEFRNHSEYRVLLVTTTATSQTPEIYGCPLIRSYAGTAAGVTGGFVTNGGTIRVIWPFVVIPHLSDSRQECRELFQAGVENEAEHLILMNNGQYFMAFTGAYDVHPIFP